MNPTNLTIILVTLVSALYFLIIGAILKRRSLRESAFGLLVLYVILSLLWTLGQAFLWLDQFVFLADDMLARLLFYGLLLLSWLFFHLSWSFLRTGGTNWYWGILGPVWIAVAIIINENLLTLPEVLETGSGWRLERQMLGFGILVLGWGIAIGGSVFLTARAYLRTQEPLHRNRITYWAGVVGLTIAAGVLFFTGHWVLGGGIHLLSTLSVTYVMLTHALPDVRQMARRILSYLIITLLTVVIYTSGILVAQYVFQSVPGYTPLVAGATVALVLAIIFDPLLRLVQRLVNRLISGTGYDPSHTLRQYSASISNILDLEHLATVALGLMSEAMAIRRGILFVAHHERQGNGGTEGEGYFRLRGVIGVGEGLPPGVSLPPGVLSVGGPLADYMGQERQPLTQYDIDLLPRFQETPPAEQAWLTSLNMVVYVPIHAKDEWIGLLAFGPKRSGDRYFDDDLVVLSTLADQTAVALENARLFDDLKIRNAENERLNEELIGANQKLALLDQAKSDFIGVASHELRTPLTHIRGYNDMLTDMLDAGALSPEGGMKLTEGVSKGVRRLEEIVNTMFDVSKIDTETLDLNTAPTSVAAVVGTVVDNFGEALEDRKQTLTVVEGLADFPDIMADRERLRQVFSHLVQNAIKYTPDEGQITITSRLLQDERMQPQDQAIEIVVADTGIGIAAEELERLFEKFYRVGDARLHSTGQTKFKGAGPGLGLTIARGVVEAHGGRIWAESPGHDEESCPGSEFHVVLPIQASHLELAGSETFIADT